MSGAGAGMPDGPDPRIGGDAGADAACGPPARLKIRPDFVRASGGGRIHGRSLSLQVYRRKDGDAPVEGCRVGLTVTKKVGNAVERNRVKRRFREALRAPSLATRPDHDYVIVARREALSAPFASLVGELRRCLGDAAAGRSKKGRPRGPAGAGPRRGKGDAASEMARGAKPPSVPSK